MKQFNIRKPNTFEIILLLIGIAGILLGYFFLQNTVERYGIYSFESGVLIIMWFALIILIILTAVSENSKEELKVIIKQQHTELKLLRDDLKRKN